MRWLLDTNILTRAAQPAHAQHESAAAAVSVLTARGDALCLVPQNLYEFWVVCTRPTGENGLGMTPAETAARLADLKTAFSLLDETPAYREVWEALVLQFGVCGKSAHDARLVAAVRVNGLDGLVTFNSQHFGRYVGLTLLSPVSLGAKPDPPA